MHHDGSSHRGSEGDVVRKLTLIMSITVDGFVAKADGGLWDAFPWPTEMRQFANDFYRGVDTAIYGRRTYETIVPWWRNVTEGHYPPDVEITDREIELANILQGSADARRGAGRTTRLRRRPSDC